MPERHGAIEQLLQKEITGIMHIAVRTSLPDNPLFIDGNADKLGKNHYESS